MDRRRLLFAAPAALAAGSALAHPPRQPDAVEATSLAEEVKAFRQRVAQAVTARDFAALRALYADDFSHTHGSGKIDDKNARIVSAMAGEPMIETAPASDLSYRVFAGPTVIVTGLSPILNVKEQKSYDFRWIAIYVTGRDGWQLAASQATRLPPA